MIVLDTNVLSELMRASPADPVVAWVGSRAALELHTTAVTQAEILFGIATMPAGRKRAAAESAAQRMFGVVLAGRVLPFATDAATHYGVIASDRRKAGRPISVMDAQIAAIARAAGATLATRNVRDFEGTGLRVVDPWTG